MDILCGLCGGLSDEFFRGRSAVYYKCRQCSSVFMGPKYRLSPAKERERYLEHNNNVLDPRYREFVTPVVSAITDNFSANDTGLDFGAGTGPVISDILKKKRYNIGIYDPFFADDKNKLENKYDYIACCEVIEHFYNPAKEFALLRSLLKPRSGSGIFCMTDIYSPRTNFEKWYYKNDPAHVFFYSPGSIEWIRKNFGFKESETEARLIKFRI